MNIKIKINLNLIKWSLTCFFLLGNLLLFAKNDDILFIVIYEISINLLAICSFVLLSFFPRLYYIFDEGGISYQTKKGKEFVYISWENIEDISYVYALGFIPDGLEVKWKDKDKVRNITLLISRKQAQELYKAIPQIQNIVDKK